MSTKASLMSQPLESDSLKNNHMENNHMENTPIGYAKRYRNTPLITTSSIIQRALLPLSNRAMLAMQKVYNAHKTATTAQYMEAMQACRKNLQQYTTRHIYADHWNPCSRPQGDTIRELQRPSVFNALDLVMRGIIADVSLVSQSQKTMACRLYNWLSDNASHNWEQSACMAIMVMEYLLPLYKKRIVNSIHNQEIDISDIQNDVQETYKEIRGISAAMRQLRYVVRKYRRCKNKIAAIDKTRKQKQEERDKRTEKRQNATPYARPITKIHIVYMLDEELVDCMLNVFEYFNDITPIEDGLSYQFKNIDAMNNDLNAEYRERSAAAYRTRQAKKDSYNKIMQKRQQYRNNRNRHRDNHNHHHHHGNGQKKVDSNSNQAKPIVFRSAFDLDGQYTIISSDKHKESYDDFDDDESSVVTHILDSDFSGKYHLDNDLDNDGSTSDSDSEFGIGIKGGKKNTNDGSNTDDDADSTDGSWANNSELKALFGNGVLTDDIVEVLDENGVHVLDADLNTDLDNNDDNHDDNRPVSNSIMVGAGEDDNGGFVISGGRR